MAIRMKIDILAALKEAGYTTYKLRQQKLIGESVIQKLSKMTGKSVSKEQEDKIIGAVINDKVPKNIDKMF